jgi:D-beta-D-heptose 7-phosphate kinase/D-beta-D-heptose 1-phosphate adenosyltransferase
MRSLPNFTEAKILCVGDIMLDRFVYGDVKRISPEAPIPVLHMKNSFSVLGGAGNVARNISSLGAQCFFLSVVGDDASGTEIKELLQNLDNAKSLVLKDRHRKTSTKTRYVSHGQQLIRVDDEIIQPLSSKMEETLFQAYKDLLTQIDVVVLSDYAKGLFQPTFLKRLIKATDKPIFVDPKGNDYEKYRGVTLIKPNLKELGEVTDISLTTQEDLEKAANAIKTDLSIDMVLATQGQNGMTLISDSHDPFHVKTTAKEVFDVSGAGDTVIATFAAAYAAGADAHHATEWANIAAGIVVGKTGTATVTFDELNQQNAIDAKKTKKIFSLSDFINGPLKEWRRHQQTISFTNGCFDLLHLGHLHSLECAASFADKLVVGVNSDASIRRLKGEDRPVQSEIVRARILSALEMVDAVIIFDEDTPQTIIESIIPDVLTKGADYAIDQIIGADIVLSNGGHIERIPLKDGFSTTNTIKKMQQIL